MLVGDSATAGVPVPDRSTDCWPPGASSLNCRLALRVARESGWNRTITLHVSLGATVAPEHVSPLAAKALASGPAIVTAPMDSGTLRLFVTTTVCSPL